MSLKDIYRHIAPLYDFLDIPFEHLLYTKMRKIGIKGLRNQRILEIGVGTGKNLPYYHESNSVVGIDNSEEMLYFAKQRQEKLATDIKIELADIEHYQSPTKYDVIVASFVLYLQDDLTKLSAKLANLLVEGGQLILIEYRRPDRKLEYTISQVLSKFTKHLYGLDFKKINTLPALLAKFELNSYKEILKQWLYIAILTKK